MREEGVSCGVSANEYNCAHGAQINFGDLTLYLTYGQISSRNLCMARVLDIPLFYKYFSMVYTVVLCAYRIHIYADILHSRVVLAWMKGWGV